MEFIKMLDNIFDECKESLHIKEQNFNQNYFIINK